MYVASLGTASQQAVELWFMSAVQFKDTPLTRYGRHNRGLKRRIPPGTTDIVRPIRHCHLSRYHGRHSAEPIGKPRSIKFSPFRPLNVRWAMVISKQPEMNHTTTARRCYGSTAPTHDMVRTRARPSSRGPGRPPRAHET